MASLLALKVSAEQLSISTVAGVPGSTGTADGTNGVARFWAPAAVASFQGTNFYITDGNAVRLLNKANTNWVLTTIAGAILGHGPDDGTNQAARFNQPEGIASDGLNNLFVADTVNHSIRKLTPSGTNWITTTVAGLSASAGFADGSNSVARFNHPYGIMVGSGGVIFVADTYNNTIRKIVTVGTNNVVTTIAGLPGVPGTSDGTNNAARFNFPVALTSDTGGNIYVADFGNSCIRKMTPVGTNWVVVTIAGQPGVGGDVDGTNKAALFQQPSGLVADSYGRIYVTDGLSNVIRKIKTIGTNYVVSTVAGTPGVTGAQDGVGRAASFNSPVGITSDGLGGLFIVDGYNFTLRLGRVAALLEMAKSGNQVTISWPVDVADMSLDSKSSVSGGTWAPVASGYVTNGDTCVYVAPTTAPSAFYRLQKP